MLFWVLHLLKKSGSSYSSRQVIQLSRYKLPTTRQRVWIPVFCPADLRASSRSWEYGFVSRRLQRCLSISKLILPPSISVTRQSPGNSSANRLSRFFKSVLWVVISIVGSISLKYIWVNFCCLFKCFFLRKLVAFWLFRSGSRPGKESLFSDKSYSGDPL